MVGWWVNWLLAPVGVWLLHSADLGRSASASVPVVRRSAPAGNLALTPHPVFQIEEEVADMDPSRPVYLLGESFGGLLGLALAQRLRCGI